MAVLILIRRVRQWARWRARTLKADGEESEVVVRVELTSDDGEVAVEKGYCHLVVGIAGQKVSE